MPEPVPESSPAEAVEMAISNAEKMHAQAATSSTGGAVELAELRAKLLAKLETLREHVQEHRRISTESETSPVAWISTLAVVSVGFLLLRRLPWRALFAGSAFAGMGWLMYAKLIEPRSAPSRRQRDADAIRSTIDDVEPWWLRRICTPKRTFEIYVEGVNDEQEVAEHLANELRPFELVLDVLSETAPGSPDDLVLMAIYPSQAVRSIAAEAIRLGDRVKFVVRDRLVLLDPRMESLVINRRTVRLGVTFFGIDLGKDDDEQE